MTVSDAEESFEEVEMVEKQVCSPSCPKNMVGDDTLTENSNYDEEDYQN